MGGGMKVRFDGLDVTAMVAHLQRTLLGRRVVNIYDGPGGEGTFCFKLDGDNGKAFLLLESGIRFHTLEHFTSEQPMPSPTCAKLRKHLRGLRLEQVRQLGHYDRVVLFQFGVGEQQRHSLVLELYAKGNLILTDAHYTILALLRSHVYHQQAAAAASTAAAAASTANSSKTEDAKDQKPEPEKPNQVAVQVGQVYPVTYAANTSDQQTSLLDWPVADVQAWILEQQQAAAAATGGKKKTAPLTLKTLLLKPASGLTHYGPALLEHCVLRAGNLEPHAPLRMETVTAEAIGRLQTALRDEGAAALENLTVERPAYVLYRPMSKSTTTSSVLKEDDNAAATTTPVAPGLEQQQDNPHADKILEEFQPSLLQQHTGRPVIEYPHFAAAVEDFFGNLLRQKRLLKAQSAQTAAESRLQKAHQHQAERLETLERDQRVLLQQAQVMQSHADEVEKALTVINSALNSGMDWEQLEQLIQVEKTKANPIAQLIQELDLEHDAMILALPTDETNDSENDEPATMEVRINLTESAHANANALFAKYRQAKEKSVKTVEASKTVFRAAEETAKRQLAEAQKNQLKAPINARKPAWFEKFHWFVTSDNYLVLGGRDAHQNELLVKRYLRPGDAYLHADVHGAASCILRAKRRRTKGNNGNTTTVPLSPQALVEAGNFTVCLSNAWGRRMVMSAWWVDAHQVTKTAPTGEYLTVGSFMIRGKKTFLPPAALEMGLAVLFRLGDDPDTVARHANERRDFALLELESNGQDDGDEEEQSEKEEADAERMEKPDANGAVGNVVANDVPGQNGNEAPQDEPAVSVDSDDEKDEDDPGDDDPPEAQVANDAQDSTTDQPATERTEPPSRGTVKSDQQATPKKRGLSVRDRKLIKKYGSLEKAKQVLALQQQQEQQSQEDCNDDDEASVASTSASVDTPAQRKRGQRGKAKRAKKKYADQDEEDRELAMLALQGGEKSKKKNKKGGSKRPTEVSEFQQAAAAETAALLTKDSAAVAENLPAEVSKVLAEVVSSDGDSKETGVRWDKFDADTLEQLMSLKPEASQVAAAKRLLFLRKTTRVDNFSASLAGIVRAVSKYGYENLETEIPDGETAKRKTKVEKEAESRKWKQTLAEEGVLDGNFDEDAVDDTVELGKLTGKPHSEDLLLAAVPVCAPYQLLSKYAYRVKLTPGSTKRGKAVKQCLDMFLRDASKTAPSASETRQKDLIKNVPENDWLQTILGDVKISSAGASKGSKKQKASGKKSKK